MKSSLDKVEAEIRKLEDRINLRKTKHSWCSLFVLGSFLFLLISIGYGYICSHLWSSLSASMPIDTTSIWIGNTCYVIIAVVGFIVVCSIILTHTSTKQRTVVGGLIFGGMAGQILGIHLILAFFEKYWYIYLIVGACVIVCIPLFHYLCLPSRLRLFDLYHLRKIYTKQKGGDGNE